MIIKNYGTEVEEIEIDNDLLYLVSYLFALIKINISKLNKRVDRYMQNEFICLPVNQYYRNIGDIEFTGMSSAIHKEKKECFVCFKIFTIIS